MAPKWIENGTKKRIKEIITELKNNPLGGLPPPLGPPSGTGREDRIKKFDFRPEIEFLNLISGS